MSNTLENLQGKTCLVTGASSGIGAAIAQTYANAGAAVVGMARRFSNESATIAAGTVCEVRGDVSLPADVERVVGGMKQIDIVVNNGGGGGFKPLEETSLQELQELLAAHVVGTFLVCKAALPKMRAGGGGLIINIGSIVVDKSFPGAAAYTAAKVGQVGIGRCLREEVREHNIRVTDISPGATATAIWGDSDFDRSKMISPQDIADVALQIAKQEQVSIERIVCGPITGAL